MDRLQSLPSARIWEIFLELSRIPRASGNEKEAAKWVAGYASARGLISRIDGTGNVLITATATPGWEQVPALAFQAHLDMVPVCDPGCSHDFTRDPLELEIREYAGEPFVTAVHTTLGADDGIGVATALAIITDPDLQHGPLEAVFTVAEETSMQGAAKFREGMLASEMMVNIDSENDQEVIIGAAGGCDLHASMPMRRTAVSGEEGLLLRFSGFTGGHSGIDIHHGRANAIITAARVVRELTAEIPLRLASFEGGTLRNAIPVNAQVLLCGTPEDTALAARKAAAIAASLKTEHRDTDPRISLEAVSHDPAPAMSPEDTRRYVKAICDLPDGVVTMSEEFPEVVESSSNLGLVTSRNGILMITALLRSLTSTGDLKKMMAEALEQAGARIEEANEYPAWTPSAHSPLLKLYEGIYQENCFSKPQINVLHAGVECGILKAAYPAMDIISLGPTIIGAHTTGERVSVPSVEKIYGLLLELVEGMKTIRKRS